MRNYAVRGLFLGSMAALALGPHLRADEELARRLDDLVKGKSPSIVSIRAVLKTEVNFGGRSQDRESRAEMQGVVVDGSGLILTSNTPLSPGVPGLPSNFDIKVTPIELKVVVEGEEKELDAFLAAKDSKLDLAFLQIKDLGEVKLQPVDFSESTDGAVGTEIYCVGRLGKGYDYAPFFTTSRLSGKIKKPRRALIHSGSISSLGLPVFTLEGALIGVLSNLESGLESEEDDQTAARGLMRALMGSSGSAGGSFILPAKSVKGPIGQAKTRAAEVAAEMKEAEKEGTGAEEEKEEKQEDEKEEGDGDGGGE